MLKVTKLDTQVNLNLALYTSKVAEWVFFAYNLLCISLALYLSLMYIYMASKKDSVVQMQFLKHNYNYTVCLQGSDTHR